MKTRGFIIKKQDYQESARILTAYTENFGKIIFLAKGVRKINSKLRAGLELFCLSEFEFVPGKTSRIIIEAIPIENFEFQKNLNKLKAAFYINSLLDKFLKEDVRDGQIWNLFLEIFKALKNLSNDNKFYSILLRYFELNLIRTLGYVPELYFCVACGNKTKEGGNYFSEKDGGLICPSCYKLQKIDAQNINPDTIKILRIILEKDFNFVQRLRLNENDFGNLKKISKELLEYISEEEMRPDNCFFDKNLLR